MKLDWLLLCTINTSTAVEDQPTVLQTTLINYMNQQKIQMYNKQLQQVPR